MTRTTPYGTLEVLNLEEIFKRTCQALTAGAANKPRTIGLTGGSTPKAFYKWVIDNQALTAAQVGHCHWYTSDERHVPLESEDSNFGNAARMLLDPLNVESGHRFPWDTKKTPQEAAKALNEAWNDRYGAEKCFDVCFLGMGDDGHTASWFPGSPLMKANLTNNFTALAVPGKGDRLTITPAGLTRCTQVIIVVTGEAKADRLGRVINSHYTPHTQPVQLLKNCATQVSWWVDEAAASLL